MQFVSEHGNLLRPGHLRDPPQEVFSVNLLLLLRILQQESVRFEVEYFAIATVDILNLDSALLSLILKVDVRLA